MTHAARHSCLWLLTGLLGGGGLPLGCAIATVAPLTLLLPGQAAEPVTWSFDPSSRQLQLTLPSGITPRYSLLAEPARLVLDIPQSQLSQPEVQQYDDGPIRSVRAAQLDGNSSRIVIEFAPGTVLDPRHAQLTSVPQGTQTRWTLTPLLADSTAIARQPSSQPSAAATAPTEVPEPTPAPEAAPEAPPEAPPEPEAAPATADSAAEPPLLPPPQISSAAGDEPGAGAATAETSAAASRRARDEDVSTSAASLRLPSARASGADSDRLPLDSFSLDGGGAAPVRVPSLEDQPPAAAAAEEPVAAAPAQVRVPPLESLAPVEPVEPTVPAEPSADNEAASDAAIAVPTPVTPSQPSPAAPESAPDENALPPTTEAGPAAPEPPEVAAADDDDATGISPPFIATPPPASGPAAETPPPPSPPASATGTAAVAPVSFGQPLPAANANANGTSPQATAVAEDVAIPAGTVLTLRYPPNQRLELNQNEPWYDVLLLDNDLQDPHTGALLAPAGSQVIGRFEPHGSGYRFVTQTLAVGTRNLPLSAVSGMLAGTPQVSGRNVAVNSGIGALATAVLSGFGGLGLIGGAALGAATTVATSPQAITIEPNQVIQVQVLKDVPRF